MSRELICAALLVLVGTASAHAQLPPGYYEVAQTQLPDSLREVIGRGRFRISVMRAAANAVERQLIERAEALMPSPEVIANATAGLKGGGWTEGFKAAAKRPGDRWWWREWDGALVPVAVTGRAALHYIERVRTLSAQANPFAQYNSGVQHSANMEYTAVVGLNALTGRREVRLSLSFNSFCGSLCAMSFSHSRVVEFDQDGRPVAVSGDGRPNLMAS